MIRDGHLEKRLLAAGPFFNRSTGHEGHIGARFAWEGSPAV
jgi:hypothetical protein